MADFAERVRSGRRGPGTPASAIRNVVNIGIGGSDLGPAHGVRGADATSADRDMTFRFVSNVDGTDFWEATHDLDPAETLFIVSSKTFTTLETLTNARTARDWLPRRARGRGGRRQALRRRVDQRREGREVRHRHRQHVRVLGLGRRPLLVRLRHRPVADDRDRPRAVPRDARRLPRDRRALPHRAVRAEPAGAARPASASGTTTSSARETQAILPYSQYLAQLPRLPPAARHGEQRQVGRPRRQPGRRADRPDRVGPARHQRPARVLPTHPPGHEADPGRLHRVRARRTTRSATTRTC